MTSTVPVAVGSSSVTNGGGSVNAGGVDSGGVDAGNVDPCGAGSWGAGSGGDVSVEPGLEAAVLAEDSFSVAASPFVFRRAFSSDRSVTASTSVAKGWDACPFSSVGRWGVSDEARWGRQESTRRKSIEDSPVPSWRIDARTW